MKFVALLLLIATPAFAADKNDALEIAKTADARSKGWKDYTVNISMSLKTEKGEETKRAMRMKLLEVPGDGEKQIAVFDRPADVKGTALLSASHEAKDDEQWLYLPAVKRVKRISSSTRSGSFMGSEFCFEDMGNSSVDKFSYKFVKKEKCSEGECSVIERAPKDKESAYSKQVVWIDKEFRTVRVDYYDRKESLYKRLTVKDFQKHLGKIWRPGTLSMENLQNKRRTEIQFSDFKFKTGLKDSDFDPDNLANVR